ncbi:hypothetical protein ACFL3Q_17285 [Planctomycetota bacterium]
MASNAKIGLLSGLIIIFVFAFIINGLSGFGDARVGDDVPPFVVVDPPGFKPDKTPKVFPPVQVPERHPEETPPPEDEEHFRGQPPGTTSPVKPTITPSL